MSSSPSSPRRRRRACRHDDRLTPAVSDYVEAFTLGNAAILSNVCLLPLYPGLVVMLSARLVNPRSRVSTMSLGLPSSPASSCSWSSSASSCIS